MHIFVHTLLIGDYLQFAHQASNSIRSWFNVAKCPATYVTHGAKATPSVWDSLRPVNVKPQAVNMGRAICTTGESLERSMAEAEAIRRRLSPL